MEDIKNTLKNILTDVLASSERYHSFLVQDTNKEQKAVVAEYYTFCCELKELISKLDALTATVSERIHVYDSLDKYDDVAQAAVIFERSLNVRKIADEFLIHTEERINSSDRWLVTELRRQTDLMIRKMSVQKNVL